MARTRSPTHDLQREAILRAAACLFARNGFHNASMADLARACGVSKPLLYHYHRDKEHILFDIADSYMDRLQAIVDEVTAQRLPAEARLRVLIGRFLACYADSQDRHMVLVQDVKFLLPDHCAQVREKERRVVAAFVEAVVELAPDLRGQDLARTVAMILFGMINWTFTWMRADGALSHAEMASLVADIFIGGVRARMAAASPAPQRTASAAR